MILKYFLIRPQVAAGAFFAVFLMIGLVVFQDYGVHVDEFHNQNFGREMTSYTAAVINHAGQKIVYPPNDGHNRIHGPVVEVFLTVLADQLKLKDSRDIILMRHLCVFLFFYIGVIFFYLLCRKCFFNSWLALLGCVFLVLSPRIFADAFYNSVDIPFLVFFIVGVFTLLSFLDRKSFLTAIAHAFVCAILMNIRLAGFLLPVLTLIFFCPEVVRASSLKERVSNLGFFAGWLVLFMVLAVSFNPFLWAAPFKNFLVLITAVKSFSQNKFYFFYMGSWELFSKMPWHYASVWIAVSTPLLYVSFFFVGIASTVSLFLKNTRASYVTKRNVILFEGIFFFSLIVCNGRIYSAWRHIYFIYPFLLITTLMGILYVWQRIRPVIRVFLVLGIVLSLLDTAAFMVRNHPYQNLYFNWLAGKNAAEISSRLELDRMGLSYRKAEEYILKTDHDARIPVYFADESSARPGWSTPGWNNTMILYPQDRTRLIFSEPTLAKYFLTNNMLQPCPYSGKEYYSISVDGLKIMSVYRLDREKNKE